MPVFGTESLHHPVSHLMCAPASLHCNNNHNWNLLLTVSKIYVVCGEVFKECLCSLACLAVVIWLQPWWVILKIAPLKQYIGSCWCTDVFYCKKKVHSPLRLLYNVLCVWLWCMSPSHHHFCTKLTTHVDVNETLSPFVKTLWFNIKRDLPDQFSIAQKLTKL